MIGHPNTIARSLYYRQLRVHLEGYEKFESLKKIDRKLMVGFFSKNIHKVVTKE
jgi:hypothetical protein